MKVDYEILPLKITRTPKKILKRKFIRYGLTKEDFNDYLDSFSGHINPASYITIPSSNKIMVLPYITETKDSEINTFFKNYLTAEIFLDFKSGKKDNSQSKTDTFLSSSLSGILEMGYQEHDFPLFYALLGNFPNYNQLDLSSFLKQVRNLENRLINHNLPLNYGDLTSIAFEFKSDDSRCIYQKYDPSQLIEERKKIIHDIMTLVDTSFIEDVNEVSIKERFYATITDDLMRGDDEEK